MYSGQVTGLTRDYTGCPNKVHCSINRDKPANEIRFFVIGLTRCQRSTMILSLGIKHSMGDLICDVNVTRSCNSKRNVVENNVSVPFLASVRLKKL